MTDDEPPLPRALARALSEYEEDRSRVDVEYVSVANAWLRGTNCAAEILRAAEEGETPLYTAEEVDFGRMRRRRASDPRFSTPRSPGGRAPRRAASDPEVRHSELYDHSALYTTGLLPTLTRRLHTKPLTLAHRRPRRLLAALFEGKTRRFRALHGS